MRWQILDILELYFTTVILGKVAERSTSTDRSFHFYRDLLGVKTAKRN